MTLRITKFLNRSTTQLQIQFSAALDPKIGIANLSVLSTVVNTLPLTVISTEITSDVLTITISPQAPYALYYVLLESTTAQLFQSEAGDRIFEDGSSNRVDFLGLERANDIREELFSLIAPTYDFEDDTIVRKQIADVANQLMGARANIREAGSANYVSIEVTDEIIARGFSNTDRLSKEGVYEITRVASSPTGATTIAVVNLNDARATALLGTSNYLNANLNIRSFPSDPISLQAVSVINEVVSNAEVIQNKFDQTLITLSHSNVAQINSITLEQEDGTTYVYDIPLYGYALLDNRYDTRSGRKLLTLESNQIKLSDTAILDDAFIVPTGTDELHISYTYINKGITPSLDVDDVSVTQLNTSTRELIGAFLTTFFLDNFPIVTSGDSIPSLDGVDFLDPNPSSGQPFTTTHPAFTHEIVFAPNRLPSGAGDYAVNYNTGQVFVFGASIADGSGSSPPVATYRYRTTFTSGLDYTYDTEGFEIAANSLRNLIGEDVKITYFYELTFADGVDFLANAHIEVVNERVDNRLVSTFRVATLKSPITNVFQVQNETTGETYAVTRFDDNYITFAGRKAPSVKSAYREASKFSRVFNEQLLVSDEIANNGTLKTVKFDLTNKTIISNSGDLIGANFNTSLLFSLIEIFGQEFYYDSIIQTLGQNLAKISVAGDYIVDYVNGIVYLVTDADTAEYGEVNYTYGTIDTTYKNVLAPSDSFYSLSNNSDVILNVTVDGFDTDGIDVSDLMSAERFLDADTGKPILLGSIMDGIAGQHIHGSTTFTALDGRFTADLADGNHILRFPDDSDRAITGFTSLTSITVDVPFTTTDRNVSWYVIDFNFADGDGYDAVTTYSVSSVRAVYAVSDLQTLAASSLVNLWDPSVDTFDGNVLTFNNSVAQSMTPGTALIVDYSIGNLYSNYTYIADNLLVSYEYGDNSIDWSISSALDAGDQYYASYKYGALREALLTNFGSLTQIPELTNFPVDFDRELYRDSVGGTIQAFVTGPTVGAIETVVEKITHVQPEIRELSFNEWTLSRDNLYLQAGKLTGDEEYADAKFDRGIVIDGSTTLVFPSEAYISLKEGTFEAWVDPKWRGLDNDATLTFDLDVDGYLVSDGYNGAFLGLSDIYIGSSAFNPDSNPFSINRSDADPISPVGRPYNFGTRQGFYIWFDSDVNEWNLKVLGDPNSDLTFSGTITTSGEFYNVRDGYNVSVSINESLDTITSTASYINFSLSVDAADVLSADGYVGLDDGYDGYISVDGYDGYLYQDGVRFLSDNIHYLWDTGPSVSANRLSLFKSGNGFLNFRAIDSGGKRNHPRAFNVSNDITAWNSGELHHIAASWRLNSPDAIDELHLFVDGQEVNNLFKFGGRPIATTASLYSSVADEVLTLAATKNIVGAADGITTASSSTFTSASSDFVAAGIIAGDVFVVLDSTIDSTISRTVLGVIDTHTLTVSASFILTLDNVSFSVNQQSFTTSTLLDTDKFVVFDTSLDATVVEMDGLNSENPDYSISKSGHDDVITFNKNVAVGDILSVNTLGLTRGRAREVVFDYRSDNILNTNFQPPSSLADVDIYKIIIKRSAIIADGYVAPPDGYWSQDGVLLDGYFSSVCQPSNGIKGKKLRVTFSGTNNTNFIGVNHVIISGTTFGGPTSETVSFTTYEARVTTNFFTSISGIRAAFTGINPDRSLGALEIIEDVSLTREENTGNYAEVTGYDNGAFSLYEFGSGGIPFNLEPCYYLLDYPTRLSIPITAKGKLYIGSDIEGANQWAGTIDELLFLNEMLLDIRADEIPDSSTRTITGDYNSILPLEVTAQTLMLQHFDNNFTNEDDLFSTYSESYLTSSRSVNSEFGDCAVFYDDSPLVIDNGPSVVINDAGTIEFWVSPFMDTYNDLETARYYIDISTAVVEEVTSITKTTLRLTHKAREIRSVRLISDDGSGTDFFESGKLAIDGLTLTLKHLLPGQFTLVKVSYIPVDSRGDRMSIYKDGYDNLNFEIIANDQVFQISYPIAWKRNTWHRVMATWDLNNVDNHDRMTLFVDGIQGGTILYGTPGLLYGIGILWGSAAVGDLGSDFLTTNIDFLDTFGQIIVGNSFDRLSPSRSRMDNLRFSKSVRTTSLVAGIFVDLNYNANLDTVLPVVEDNFTSAIYDFDKDPEETGFLANALHEATPLFTFDVNVIDSFRRIADNERAQQLLSDVINRLKPSHTSAHISFVE